jgi:hypothetical protein
LFPMTPARNNKPTDGTMRAAKQTDESILPGVRAWFDAIARAQGWKCAACGELIQVEDRYVYFETWHCARCECLDPRNG